MAKADYCWGGLMIDFPFANNIDKMNTAQLLPTLPSPTQNEDTICFMGLF